MNDLQRYASIFDGIRPFRGHVPRGFIIDFLGCRTDARFRQMWGVDPKAAGGTVVETSTPRIELGEGWFEYATWILAAREARDRFVMVTLGACYGRQAVDAYRA